MVIDQHTRVCCKNEGKEDSFFYDFSQYSDD